MLELDLRRRGFDPVSEMSSSAAFERLKTEDADVVLTDLNLPGMNGIVLCEQIAANRPDVPVIVITAFGSLETAVAAIRAGAYDFVTKPVDTDVLALSLGRAVGHRRLREQVTLLNRTVEQLQPYDELIGRSLPMRGMFDRLSRISETEASVLITGETGTGKELVARVLHKRSARRKDPFVPVDCASLPESLLESELFGHARGAFTDARTARKGLFLQANGGTMFLDEIGDLPLSLQPKLLRAIEGRSVRPVGGDAEVSFDARLIAATNQDLESAVEEGRFREDLFYRLNVIPVRVPPLRARGTDILLLAQHFLERYAADSRRDVTGISVQAADRLLGYSWPGNVRELRNVIERAVALTRFEKIAVDDLPKKIRSYRQTQVMLGGDNPAELVTLEEVERRYILHVLRAVGDNKTLAAKMLGLDRKTLYRKLQRYEE